MNFRSDNTATVAAEILAALTEVNKEPALAYGDDQWSRKLEEKFSAVFERDVRVFTVATGTAANSISLASAIPPWGSILCHREAHIECDESGAPEFYSGGAKLALIDGAAAKITPRGVKEALGRTARSIHSVQPSAISISQTTERGAIYRPEEVAAIGELARNAGLALHMDGARFANAVAALGCKPANVSWRGGVDLLSFGATKNGAMAAEAIICFNPEYAEQIAHRRKRGGHLFSKNRYVAAQLLAYLENDLWLKLAARANRLARRLGEAAGPFLTVPVESNQVFLKPGPAGFAKLRAAGVEFYDWGSEGSGEARLVVSWNQDEGDVEAMQALLASLH
jgi:threonine aldolase